MEPRFIVEHDHVRRASALVDRTLSESALFCYHPDGGDLEAIAQACEDNPDVFQGFARQPLQAVR